MTETALHAGDSPAYADAILSYLGDRNPIDVLETSEALLRDAVAGLSDEALRTPEAPGKWSIIQVVQHLAEAEMMLGQRYRTAIAEPGSQVIGRDQDAWAVALESQNADLEEAFALLAAVRRANLAVLKSTTPEQRENDYYAMHNERGKETLGHMVRIYAAHDLYHIHQIARIRKAIGK